MKKVFFLVAFIAATLSVSAQTGELSLLGQLGYQTNYERFALGVQGRYNITNAFRLAPDITFFFPKDKVTGLDINLNLHYVFRFNNERLTFYPLAGFGMQNNFFGKRNIAGVEVDSDTKTHLGFNLGAGLTYDISAKSFLNVEGKFMFADEDNAVFMVGYGWRF